MHCVRECVCELCVSVCERVSVNCVCGRVCICEFNVCVCVSAAHEAGPCFCWLEKGRRWKRSFSAKVHSFGTTGIASSFKGVGVC